MATIWSDLYSLKKKKRTCGEGMYSIPIPFFCFVAISVLRRFNLAFMEAYQIYILYVFFSVIFIL